MSLYKTFLSKRLTLRSKISIVEGIEISPQLDADALEADRRVVTGLDAAAAAAADEVDGANRALPRRPPLVEGESAAAAADDEPADPAPLPPRADAAVS